jgi:hypothetical protein
VVLGFYCMGRKGSGVEARSLAETQTAWLTLVGTLGGVGITACFGLLTAYFTHRWQQQRVQRENQFSRLRDLRAARRDTYVRYIISAQDVFDQSFSLYVANHEDPIDPAAFRIDPPHDFGAAVTRNESLRVETMLLAGPLVEHALAEYDAWLKRFWPQAASGTELRFQRDENHCYHQLVQAMQEEVTKV